MRTLGLLAAGWLAAAVVAVAAASRLARRGPAMPSPEQRDADRG